jgi:uncharacterized membrane protein
LSVSASLLLARVLHVVAGTMWTGGAVLIALYILPAARAAGPAGSVVLRELTAVRRLPEVLLGLAVVTILSGIYLLGVASGGFQPEWLHSGRGVGYLLGGTAALIAFAIGAAINIPTARRIGVLASQVQSTGAPPIPEQEKTLRRLSLRLLQGIRAVAALVTIATTLMALARYLA